MSLLPLLASTVHQLTQSFDEIPAERKVLLEQLSHVIREKTVEDNTTKLVFICTHNSRRSLMAQLWAQAAALHFGVKHVQCFSGGTEATAFYPAAVKALKTCGFEIIKESTAENPVYMVRFAADVNSIGVWSKQFDLAPNPSAGFCAIMTCTDADVNCPVVRGAEKRISIPYQDPKLADATALQQKEYLERAQQIGREMLYVFSNV
ncbi:protein-tyrosine-phosphatase [Pontibacter sp. MBLB2868]|uniref:protein-tyrosine-phosphatase n=1 Tax=Pontibacter sp. MBLB2868 TaxID=3451555 RepID=UPI003F74D728